MLYECWVFSWSLLLLINILNRKPSKFKFPMVSPSPKIDTPQVDIFFIFEHTKNVSIFDGGLYVGAGLHLLDVIG